MRYRGDLLAGLWAATGLATAVIAHNTEFDISSIAPSARQEVNNAGTARTDAVTRQLVSDVFERPLFRPTRRPAPPVLHDPEPDVEPEDLPMETLAEQIEPPSELRLLGTMRSGENSLALVASGTNAPLWMTSGQTIGGWKISSVRSEMIAVVPMEGGEAVEPTVISLYPTTAPVDTNSADETEFP